MSSRIARLVEQVLAARYRKTHGLKSKNPQMLAALSAQRAASGTTREGER